MKIETDWKKILVWENVNFPGLRGSYADYLSTSAVQSFFLFVSLVLVYVWGHSVLPVSFSTRSRCKVSEFLGSASYVHAGFR